MNRLSTLEETRLLQVLTSARQIRILKMVLIIRSQLRWKSSSRNLKKRQLMPK